MVPMANEVPAVVALVPRRGCHCAVSHTARLPRAEQGSGGVRGSSPAVAEGDWQTPWEAPLSPAPAPGRGGVRTSPAPGGSISDHVGSRRAALLSDRVYVTAVALQNRAQIAIQTRYRCSHERCGLPEPSAQCCRLA